MTYRAIQILEMQLNNYASVRIVPIFMGGVPMVEILGVYAVIKFHAQLPLPGLIILTEGYLTAFTAIMVFETLASILNTKSAEMLRVWRQVPNKSKRKELRALRPLKVKFGSNFIDQGTPLVSQDFCINQIVSLLLMK